MCFVSHLLLRPAVWQPSVRLYIIIQFSLYYHLHRIHANTETRAAGNGLFFCLLFGVLEDVALDLRHTIMGNHYFIAFPDIFFYFITFPRFHPEKKSPPFLTCRSDFPVCLDHIHFSFLCRLVILFHFKFNFSSPELWRVFTSSSLPPAGGGREPRGLRI